MAKVEFKASQKDAIEIRKSNILVSAGAGSGKTTVLVERIIQMITGFKPIDINRLLIVTFTEAAASHMRQKISDALIQKMKANPRDENLRKQFTLINKSNIMTIHSFCLSVARRFFHKIDMDPSFRVADTAEISLLKGKILDELFEEKYAEFYSEGRGENFIKLAGLFDARVSDDGLRAAVLRLHEYARSAPNPTLWLESSAAQYELAQGFENSLWYREFLQQIELMATGVLDSLDKAIRLARDFDVAPKFRAAIEDDLQQVERAQSALTGGFDALSIAWNFPYARFPGGKQNIPEDAKLAQEKIKTLRADYKKSIDKIRKLFTKSYQQTMDDIKSNHAILEALTQTVLEFSRRFQAEKCDDAVVDFNDFEHFCLEVLTGEDGESLTPEAREIGALFDEIFIDEYQDSSLIQEAILAAVARAGKAKRFMVGDVKQCIYQFRMARPKIFRDKATMYSQNPSEGRVLSLMDNFRSRRPVISAINHLFASLMSTAVGGVAYDAENSLKFAAKFDEDENDDFKAVVHIIEKNSDDENEHADDATELLTELLQGQAEAKIVAAEIRKIYSRGNVKYSDIVILLRSKTAAHAFAEELKNHDIPSFYEGDDDYFLASEVMVILALLQIIDNPRQDIPLLTVLFSDIFQFTADELVEINKNRDRQDFYAALNNFTRENLSPLAIKARNFLDRLIKWREIAAFTTTSQLIFRLYEDTNYYNYVGLLPGGELRRANLMLLFEKATAFEDGSFKGIFNFVRYIEKLKKNKHNLEKARVANENEDLVRIMTIHKSKGLEFPFVFLCQLGKRFNLRDASASLVMDFDLGIGLKNLDSDLNIISDTLPRRLIANKIASEQISEEMRILYVALTRCMEKIFLVGTAADAQKYAHLEGAPSPHDVAAGRSYMDWVLMALGDAPPADLWDVVHSSEGAIKRDEQKKQTKLANVFRQASEQASSPSPLRHQIFANLDYKYQHENAIFVPAKMSVSEIKRLYFNEFLHDSESLHPREGRDFAPPNFISDKSSITPASRGIAVHTVLEHIDFNKGTPAEIAALVAELEQLKLLTPEEVKILPVPMIAAFLASPLASRMRKAVKIHREVPFAISLPPNLINSTFQDAEGDMVVHGVIDCVFEEKGKLVIVDYKTERVTGELTELVEKYRPQMELYKIAANKIFRLQIDEVLIYFFDKGQVIVL